MHNNPVIEALKLLIDDYEVFMAGGQSLFDWSCTDGYGIG